MPRRLVFRPELQGRPAASAVTAECPLPCRLPPRRPTSTPSGFSAHIRRLLQQGCRPRASRCPRSGVCAADTALDSPHRCLDRRLWPAERPARCQHRRGDRLRQLGGPHRLHRPVRFGPPEIGQSSRGKARAMRRRRRQRPCRAVRLNQTRLSLSCTLSSAAIVITIGRDHLSKEMKRIRGRQAPTSPCPATASVQPPPVDAPPASLVAVVAVDLALAASQAAHSVAAVPAQHLRLRHRLPPFPCRTLPG